MFMEYTRTQMRKELILCKLKDKGFRITKQRLILLDIILSEKCTCCKEIYYRAVEQDPGIGVSTVYRLVWTHGIFIEQKWLRHIFSYETFVDIPKISKAIFPT